MFLCCCCGNPRRDVKIDEEDLHQATNTSNNNTLTEDEVVRDYDDLIHLARKREVRVTIRKGTQAGMVAGLSVMTGVIVAGPVGAAIGGSIGTAMAMSMSRNVVSVCDLLANTPKHKRHEIVTVFRQSFAEEFRSAIDSSPELKLMLGGMSIIAITRYMMDRNLLQNEQLERLDCILKKIA